jgi:hypothetical protein
LLLIVLAVPIQAVAILLGGIGVEELLVGLVILVLTAVTYGCVGLYWSARLRTTRAAMLLAYVTTLLGVVALPFGLLMAALVEGVFGNRSDFWFWPAAWLLNGPTASGVMTRPGGLADAGPFAPRTDAILAQLAIATNPLLTGVTSAAGLTQGRPLYGVEQVGAAELLYVAPWLTFGVLHLLAIFVLIWLTGRALRRDAR